MIKWYSRHFVFWYFKKSIDLLDSLKKWKNFYLVALSPKPIRLIFITCTTIKMYFLIKRYYMYQFKLHFPSYTHKVTSFYDSLHVNSKWKRNLICWKQSYSFCNCRLKNQQYVLVHTLIPLHMGIFKYVNFLIVL